MTQSPPPGWYTDPSNGTGMRWWDGQAWSMSTMPSEQPVGAQPVAQPIAAAAPAGVTTPTYGGVPSYGSAPVYGGGQVAYPVAQASNGVVPAANRYAIYTFGVVAVYIVLALTAGIVLLGIVPVMMSIRSLNAKEKLAPLALASAVVSVVVAFTILSGH
jgi:hypothetical protein